MTALTATPLHVDVPVRARHLVSVPTGAAVPSRPSRQGAATRTRLTRRGRLAITLSVVAAASVAGASLAVAGPGAGVEQVTVEPGQTLSGIAAVEMAGVPTSEAVTRIQVANGLSTSHVHAGQTLTIPAP